MSEVEDGVPLLASPVVGAEGDGVGDGDFWKLLLRVRPGRIFQLCGFSALTKSLPGVSAGVVVPDVFPVLWLPVFGVEVEGAGSALCFGFGLLYEMCGCHGLVFAIPEADHEKSVGISTKPTLAIANFNLVIISVATSFVNGKAYTLLRV